MITGDKKEILPRILYIEPTGEIGGSGVSLLTLAVKLDRYSPYVVVPRFGNLVVKLRQMRIPVYLLPLPKGSRLNPTFWAFAVLKLFLLCKKLNIKLVHVNHEFANRHGWAAAQLANLPYICHVRNINTKGSFRHHWLSLASVLIANSNATANSYSSWLKKGQHSLVIYNGVDLCYFDGQKRSKDLFRFSPKDFVITQIGRIVRDKGVHIFIEAIASLIARFPFIRGLVVGNSSDERNDTYISELKKLVNYFGLENKVLFFNFLDNIRDIYGISDLIVQPSLIEPFGRVLAEAMAMRIPVIATNVGGQNEIVKDGISGLLIPPNNQKALAHAIELIIENKTFAMKLGENGRFMIEQRFSQQQHVSQIQKVYDKLIN
jgi:glycosyltransferase involved in cell wall biosynthesis